MLTFSGLYIIAFLAFLICLYNFTGAAYYRYLVGIPSAGAVCGHHESPPVTLLYQAAVERSEISRVQCGNLAMDIVADVLMTLDAEGGRLLDAVTATSLWKGSSGILLMGDDPPETPSPFGPFVLD